MYQATNILDEVNFDNLEYAYLTIRTLHTSPSFDLWIPKLMSPLPFGTKNSWTVGIGSPLENGSGCKITHGKTLPMQNFVTIYRHQDTDFESRAEPDNKLPVGQQFIVTLMNHDPRDIKILKIM